MIGMNKLLVPASFVIVSLLGGNILADEPARLALGSRLRVTADQILVGRLVAQDEHSLTLQLRPGKAPVVVPRERITTLERSLRPGQKGVGAASGALLGALFSVFIGVAVSEDCPGPPYGDTICISRGEGMLASAVILVPIGTLIGLVAAHGERWEVVSGHHRLAVRVAPTRSGGMTASVSLRF